MIIKFEEKVTKFKQFLDTRACLRTFEDNLMDSIGDTIEEHVRLTDYSNLISCAFGWEDCEELTAENWSEINDQWYTTIKCEEANHA